MFEIVWLQAVLATTIMSTSVLLSLYVMKLFSEVEKL